MRKEQDWVFWCAENLSKLTTASSGWRVSQAKEAGSILRFPRFPPPSLATHSLRRLLTGFFSAVFTDWKPTVIAVMKSAAKAAATNTSGLIVIR